MVFVDDAFWDVLGKRGWVKNSHKGLRWLQNSRAYARYLFSLDLSLDTTHADINNSYGKPTELRKIVDGYITNLILIIT